MFLLVPAYPGCPGSKAVKRSLLLLFYAFFGHLARISENSDASQAIFEPPPENWRRPPAVYVGIKNIHDDLSSLDLGIHEARDLVQTRPL